MHILCEFEKGRAQRVFTLIRVICSPSKNVITRSCLVTRPGTLWGTATVDVMLCSTEFTHLLGNSDVTAITQSSRLALTAIDCLLLHAFYSLIEGVVT